MLHSFSITRSTGHCQSTRLNRKSKLIWGIITLSCIITLCIGSMKKSFTFEFEGLIGIIMGESRKNSYSLITLGTSLPKNCAESKQFRCIDHPIYVFLFCTFDAVGLFTDKVDPCARETGIENHYTDSSLCTFIIVIVIIFLEESRFIWSHVSIHRYVE